MIDYYIFSTPLFYILITLILYSGSSFLYKKFKFPLIHPVFISIILIILFLTIFDIPYESYMEGGKIISFFLGPSVVALAVPLYKERKRIIKNIKGLSIVVPLGSLIGIVSAIIPGLFYKLSPGELATIAPKSVTTPIAMGIASSLNGIPDLTAALVIFTGIFGVLVGPIILRLFGVLEEAAYGFALGFACHGIGTAKALESGLTAGAYSGLALGLNGVATAVITPLLFRIFFH